MIPVPVSGGTRQPEEAHVVVQPGVGDPRRLSRSGDAVVPERRRDGVIAGIDGVVRLLHPDGVVVGSLRQVPGLDAPDRGVVRGALDERMQVPRRDQDAQRRAGGDIAMDGPHCHARVNRLEPIEERHRVLPRQQPDVEVERLGPGVRAQDRRRLVPAAEGVEPADQCVPPQAGEILARNLNHIGVARDVIDEAHPGIFEPLALRGGEVVVELDQEDLFSPCDQAAGRESRQSLGDRVEGARSQDDRFADRAPQRQLVPGRGVGLQVFERRLRRAESHLRCRARRRGGVAVIDGGVRPRQGDPAATGGDHTRHQGRNHGREGHRKPAP
jgi:hypothetical protein